MATPTAPARRSPSVDQICAAVRRELRERLPDGVGEIPVTGTRWTDAEGRSAPVVLVGVPVPAPGRPVVAAVDDDGCTSRVVRYAAEQARRLAVPLRVVHVWTGQDRTAPSPRTRYHDGMCDADRLLSAVLYDHLPQAEADAAEREIRHDSAVVPSLTTLSATASLVVVAACSRPPSAECPLGDTARALVGRTACPLAVLAPEPGAGA